MPIKKGDVVKIEYEGTLDDGTVFDTSEKHGEPLEFTVGSGQVIEGFESAVVGMDEGDEKEFKIQPEEAYGDHDPKLIQKIQKEEVEIEVKPGMLIAVTLADGTQIPVKIKEVTDDDVIIDLNHPLAGEVLNFKIKVVGIAS